MPRGRIRNQRKRNARSRDAAAAHRRQAVEGAESLSSEMYSKGRAVKYAYRVNGPTFPVVVKHINDTV